MTRPWAPFTGFGDDPSTSVKFGILVPDGTQMNWSGGPKLVQRTIPGGHRVNTRRTGRAPYEISLRIFFANTHDLERLDAMQGDVSMLRYAWGLTKPVGGYHAQHDGRAYLVLPETRLLQLSDEIIEVDGTAECTARFQREYREVAS